ncbi:hypothetical protein L2W58_00160 [Dethiosulfovibrio sp. F2B]|uniref:hypothetical protein n=1 Tax=Dethiosulfovibrio faecalis TaxID=2720018 RepID=UPI001F2A319B|nr:hypothetical protein [Dethiosulfovibrio faecalis]
MSVTVSWKDMATPWVEDVIREFPEFRRRALKSVGWMMQKEIKKGIESGAPGGRRYAPLSGVARGVKAKSKLRVMKKKKVRSGPLGKLRKAVGYQYKDDGSLTVGWLSKSAVYLGSMQEKGRRLPVTEKMRRFWWSGARAKKWPKVLKKGVRLRKETREIILPARPTIGPMREVLVPRIPGYFVKKIDGYMEDDMKRSTKKSKRKYRVYGSWW